MSCAKSAGGEVDFDSEEARAKDNRALLLRQVICNLSVFGILFFGQISYANRWTIDEVYGLQTQNTFSIKPGVTRLITYHYETVSNP